MRRGRREGPRLRRQPRDRRDGRHRRPPASTRCAGTCRRGANASPAKRAAGGRGGRGGGGGGGGGGGAGAAARAAHQPPCHDAGSVRATIGWCSSVGGQGIRADGADRAGPDASNDRYTACETTGDVGRRSERATPRPLDIVASRIVRPSCQVRSLRANDRVSRVSDPVETIAAGTPLIFFEPADVAPCASSGASRSR